MAATTWCAAVVLAVWYSVLFLDVGIQSNNDGLALHHCGAGHIAPRACHNERLARTAWGGFAHWNGDDEIVVFDFNVHGIAFTVEGTQTVLSDNVSPRLSRWSILSGAGEILSCRRWLMCRDEIALRAERVSAVDQFCVHDLDAIVLILDVVVAPRADKVQDVGYLPVGRTLNVHLDGDVSNHNASLSLPIGRSYWLSHSFKTLCADAKSQ